MATLILGAVGTLLGGPLGGAIGALVGRQVDTAIIGTPTREGPRIKELGTTTSTYGSALPRHYGRMRAAGTVIWATDLVEHAETQGGGKRSPTVKTYTYTASFAVAVSSRRIAGIGRIWADGNLLRGAEGDLKAGGQMRLYPGTGDQAPDPLIAAHEGGDRCPAWRGLAYVVFEDLELGDFYNRIPALTFEILAEAGDVPLQAILDDAADDCDAALALEGVQGWTVEGPVVDTLRLLDPVFPMSADAGGERLTIARERLQSAPIALPEAAVAVGDDSFGGAAGFSRKRSPAPENPPEILRYYDVDRDYLPGAQRAIGRTGAGQPQTVELPAALDAGTAQHFAERLTRRALWARDRIAWRTATLDTRVAPGAIVTLPDRPGRWRVLEWEWGDKGVELALERIVPQGADAPPATGVDSGRASLAADILPPPSALAAFELPWDGSGTGDAALPYAAVSSTGANWAGAALFVDHGDQSLLPLGSSGRSRATIGTTLDALPPANPLLFDRSATVTVQLLAPDMDLADASGRNAALGANRALIGNEIVQFCRAVPLGGGQWRLERLLRGRGGTEGAVGGHGAGERFVLLDGRPRALDPAIVGAAPATQIVALGRGDAEPVASAIALQGIALRPLSPIRPIARLAPDGSLGLGWTRRARGAWLWSDGVDAPLHEQAELYVVTLGPVASPLATWTTPQPQLVLSPAIMAQLSPLHAGQPLHVRQQGTYALSEPLLLATLP